MAKNYLSDLNSVNYWINLMKIYSQNRSFRQDDYEAYLFRELEKALSGLETKLSELVADRAVAKVISDIHEEANAVAKVISDNREEVNFRDYPDIDIPDIPDVPDTDVDEEDEVDAIVKSDISSSILHRLELLVMKYFGILPSSLDLGCLIPLASYYQKFVAEARDKSWLKFEENFDWNIIYKGFLHTYTWSCSFTFWDFLSLNFIVRLHAECLHHLDMSDKQHQEAIDFLLGFRQGLYSFVSKNDYEVLCLENRNNLVKGLYEILDTFDLWDNETDDASRKEVCKEIAESYFPVKYHDVFYFSDDTLKKAVLKDIDFLLDETKEFLVESPVPLEHKWLGGELSNFLSGKMPKVLDENSVCDHWIVLDANAIQDDTSDVFVFGTIYRKWNGPIYRNLLTRVVRRLFDTVKNGQSYKFKDVCTLDEVLDFLYEYDYTDYGELIPYVPFGNELLKNFKDVIPYLAINFVLATGRQDIRYPNIYAVVQQYRRFVRESEDVRLNSFRLILKSNNLGFVSDSLPDDSILELLRHFTLTPSEN